jgi:hypothetical protein
MKKPRADAKLKTLPEGVQAELWELLNVAPPGAEGPMTYAEAREWLAAPPFGVETSSAALSEWYSWYGLALRSARAKDRAAQAAALAAKDDPAMSVADLERLGQMVFTAETIEDKDIKGYVSLMRLKIQHRQLDHDERRIALLEETAARVKATLTEVVRDGHGKGGLTAETLKRIEEAASLL